jgi:hypothetical protein
MDTLSLIVLIACAAVIVLALAFVMLQRQRSRHFKDEFGTEYDRAVRKEGGSPTKAERDLDARRKRVEALGIRPLSREQAEQYTGRWQEVQARFVEEPQKAIEDADRLLNDVMMARGYPVGDFERQVEDLSVEHGRVIAGYRKAHGIAAARQAGVEPETEQVRQAFLCYRDVFADLLGTDTPLRREDSPPRRAVPQAS